MTAESALEGLLALCTVRLRADRGPQGTAFFVAVGYAVTAAHVVDGVLELPVRLHGRSGTWHGQVVDARPPSSTGLISPALPYPAPDIALIKIHGGPEHVCALLADQPSADGAEVKARGYSRRLGNVTAETESFQLAGELETLEPGSPLIKLGHGEAAPGMSGGPVVDKSTGEVIGMLRTSRSVGTSLGAWVVPADVIRRLWPEEVGSGNDLFHQKDGRWRRVASRLREGHQPADSRPTASGGVSIGTLQIGQGAFIGGDNLGVVNIGVPEATRRRGGRDVPGGE